MLFLFFLKFFFFQAQVATVLAMREHLIIQSALSQCSMVLPLDLCSGRFVGTFEKLVGRAVFKVVRRPSQSILKAALRSLRPYHTISNYLKTAHPCPSYIFSSESPKQKDRNP